MTGCPCGTGRDYEACCEPIHRDGAGLGLTAEQLMRARYTAYVQHNADFLRQSWHPDHRPNALSFDPTTTWEGLTIEATENGGGLDSIGTVEFKARFTRGGEGFVLHELSNFVRVGGKWVYTDGADPDTAPGR